MKYLLDIIFLFCCLQFATLVVARYDLRDGQAEVEGILNCYGVTCPEGSVACSKLSESSDDLMYLNTVVKCEDKDGNTLDTKNEKTSNPFPGTKFSSFSFQGNYRIRLGGSSGRNGLGNTAKTIPRTSFSTNFNNNNPQFGTADNDVEVFGDQGLY